MPLACVYHPVEGMKVVSFDERDKMLATGMWFDHPTKAKEAGENHEKQIRRQSEQGSVNGECASIETGSGTLKQESVRKKGSKRTS